MSVCGKTDFEYHGTEPVMGVKRSVGGALFPVGGSSGSGGELPGKDKDTRYRDTVQY